MVSVNERFTLVPGVLVDRHHRGAIVMVGMTMFAIAESAARVLEQVQWGERMPDETSRSLALDLVERGVLRVLEEKP